ncbi:MAG: hypothetical protein Q7R47_01095, partial [Candidatus Diapherotrites archaeon]|nr:hypothetical protein [Candidatus Diapherotrites archaeon]
MSDALHMIRPYLGLAALLTIWIAVSVLTLFPPLILPSPWAVASALAHLASTGALGEAVFASAIRIGIGYALALLFAIPVGLLIG